MRKKIIVFLILMVSLSLQSAALYAEESTVSDKSFELSGFGTLGSVYQNSPGVIYRRDISQTLNGATAGQVSFQQDSMLAVQGTKHLNQSFDVTAQVVSRLNAEGNFAPQVSMGYLKYQSDETFMRVGRMTIEAYMQGDSAEVGYANLLVRQPVVFYPRTFDGLDAEKTISLGAGLIRVKGAAGYVIGKIASPGYYYDLAGSPGGGGLMEYSQAGWTGRIAYYSVKMANELDAWQPGSALATVLPSLPNSTQIFNTMSMKDRTLSYTILGMAYDAGAIQGGAGYSVLTTHDWTSPRTAYVFGGYRFDKLTPYISYAWEQTPRQFVSTGIPNGLSPQYDALNQAIAAGQAAYLLNQSDLGIGLRYDFAQKMALKFQFDNIRYQDPESIVDPSLLVTPPQTLGYKTLNLYSVALDFVF